jgi:hypothetical protein
VIGKRFGVDGFADVNGFEGEKASSHTKADSDAD